MLQRMEDTSYSVRRRRKRRLYRLRQRVIESSVILVCVLLVVLLIRNCSGKGTAANTSSPTEGGSLPSAPVLPVLPSVTADTFTLTEEINSQSAVLIDCTENSILAAKDAQAILYPASITKVMALLVAVENIDDYSDTFTMTYDILHPLYLENATIVGFMEDEVVPLTDLLYGAILPSGADATQALAEYVSGSEEAFAELMNQRAREMGLQNTHFVNTSGLHDSNHYTCALDMAIILREAMKNELCRQVLTTHTYVTEPTPQHPEGIPLANAMIGRVKTNPPQGATVLGGKTGYTSEAGHTMVSMAIGDNGHEYIFVSLKAADKYKATNDAIATYSMFCSTNNA